jgi:hypothetical protein
MNLFNKNGNVSKLGIITGEKVCFLYMLLSLLFSLILSYLNPTWSFFYRLPRVVWSPSFDETETENTETSQVVYSNSRSCCQAHGHPWRDPTGWETK